ncbi:MAG: hypothetical protein WEF86_02015 [Gemmatimonadota bacterium]
MTVALLIGAVLAWACTGGDEADSAALSDTVPAPARPMDGMDGMGGMQSGTMMTQMSSHMEQMRTAGADSMMRMMPDYRQMSANMLSQMNSEMRDMNMEGDARWNATVDSVRQDLARMPDLSVDEMQALVPAHHERMTRLMEMHRTMAAGLRH